MFSVTCFDSGADLAKLRRYFREKVRDTDCCKIMLTPASPSSSPSFAWRAMSEVVFSVC